MLYLLSLACSNRKQEMCAESNLHVRARTRSFLQLTMFATSNDVTLYIRFPVRTLTNDDERAPLRPADRFVRATETL